MTAGAGPHAAGGHDARDASADSADDATRERAAHTAARVLRARDGDRAAFGELYAEFAGPVHAVLLGLVAPREAQDLVQDVFVTALDRLAQLTDPARFGPWVLRIARNRATDLLRSPARRVEALELAAEPAAAEPREGADEERVAALALDALRRLPEAYRETLAMRLVEGLNGREIAARTGLTYGSVRVNLCRGMKVLRERLCAVGIASERLEALARNTRR